MNKLKRGDMFLIDFGNSDKATNKQLGVRPAIIVSNDLNNKYSPTIVAIPISSNMSKCKLPTHVRLSCTKDGTIKPSFAMAEQIQTVDKTDIIKKLSVVSDATMEAVDAAMMIQLGLVKCEIKQFVV